MLKNNNTTVSEAQIVQWYHECLASLYEASPKESPEGERRNRTNLFISDRKNSAFSVLMYRGVSALVQKLDERLKVGYFPKLSHGIPQSFDFFDEQDARMYIKGDRQDMIFHTQMLYDTDGKSLLSGLKNPMDRFKFVFMHEVAHGLLADDFFKSHQGLQYFKQSSMDDPDLLLGFIYLKGTMDEFPGIGSVIEGHFKKSELPTQFISDCMGFNEVYEILMQEMFCDCFATLMHAAQHSGASISDPSLIFDNLNATTVTNVTTYEDLIDTVAYNRRKVCLGSSFAYTDFKDTQMSRIQNHETSLALFRLKDILKIRSIEPRDLKMDEIKSLCQEATTYGMARFMYEMATINPSYKKYLDCIELYSEQQNLFDFEPKKAIDKIFDILSESDKTESKLKIKELKTIANLLNEKNANTSVKFDGVTASFSLGDHNAGGLGHQKRNHETITLTHEIDEKKLTQLQKTYQTRQNLEKFSQNYVAIWIANQYVVDKLKLTHTTKDGKKTKSAYVGASQGNTVSVQTDLLDKINHHRMPSGIQEVKSALSEVALNAISKIVLIPPKKHTPP